MTNTPANGSHPAPEIPPRMAWVDLIPDVFEGLVRLDTSARSGLDRSLLELVRIRASQINHCAFCLDIHTKAALASGESVERIIQLSAWEESQHFYTERELAALELTEAVTVLTDGFVPDEVYNRAAAVFEEKELANLIASIVVINAWNRFGVSTRKTPGGYTLGRD
ncbi:carboxymuconolactone decarboxylase family protein [Streptomyces sp. NPDC046324]|uniref:carboxymuconolactone decarboxylase family protein n=1 Tax=unclassified Streptomyces TaxID=2593676 RepID=UPI0033D9B118